MDMRMATRTHTATVVMYIYYVILIVVNNCKYMKRYISYIYQYEIKFQTYKYLHNNIYVESFSFILYFHLESFAI
jgi:hypothetical protein